MDKDQKLGGLPSDGHDAVVPSRGHWNNQYATYMGTDNELCKPVLTTAQIESILERTSQVAAQIVGPGRAPTLSLDLEHLQIADYAAFPPVAIEQADVIRAIQKRDPIRADELTYLALRSLFEFHWPSPESESDVQRAAAFEFALEAVLKEVCPSATARLSGSEVMFPNWGRLAFLRVMASIPDEQIKSYSLESVGCVLLKDPAFNARSFAYDAHGLIGLNFAVEPILKGLNRMLLHFFDSQHLAGPTRMGRVWSALAPLAVHFYSRRAVPANFLVRRHPLFSEEMARTVHSLTASQVDFIVRHELGHLVLDHGRQLRAVGAEEVNALRREFEFAADAFAQGSLRSALYSALRFELQSDSQQPGDADMRAMALLQDHQSGVTGARLLLTYMNAIEEAAELLRNRLKDSIPFRPSLGSHPPALERMERLDAFHVGEPPPTSKVLRYASELLAGAVGYAKNLDQLTLEKSLDFLQ